MPAHLREHIARWWPLLLLGVVLSLPAIDPLLTVLESNHRFGDNLALPLPIIMVYAIIGLGLTIIAGFTGLLNLGGAAFMAIGAYTFSILTCPIYPFQVGFWPGLAAATLAAGIAGMLLSLPTMRLRGDYLAIVTLGFGEIVQDCLRNLDAITKGTQSLNPVAAPGLPFVAFGDDYRPTYYLYLVLLIAAVWLCHNLRHSRLGRAWVAVREDELAARSMGLTTPRVKLIAFAVGSALCGLGGALYASKSGTSLDPAFYDFQQSVIILCIVIIGGMGSITGALLGALIIAGLNGIVLTNLTEALKPGDMPDGSPGTSSNSVLASPGNWKFLLYGLTLILMMRLRPEGLIPAQDAPAGLRHDDATKAPQGAR